MGHATITNVSKLFNKRIRAQGAVTIRDVAGELERKHASISASEGMLDEPYILRMATEYLVFVLHEARIIEPVSLSRKQRKIYGEWKREEMDDWDAGDDGDGGEYAVFDSIRWRSLRKRLPIVDSMEN